jgi:Leucine-rich repeat (LRR) protein
MQYHLLLPLLILLIPFLLQNLSFLFNSKVPSSSSLSHKCNPHEKPHLLKIKNELGNPPQLSSWNPNTDCCEEWVGIVCSFHRERDILCNTGDHEFYAVNILNLSNLDLPEPLPIPPSIIDIPSLNTLSFDHIPNLIGSIPPSIARLTKLEHFFIRHTNISGEIPNAFSQMKSLVGITLTNNKLTGTLPETLPSLPNLRGIAFNDNHLTGPIPESYGSFSNSFTVLSVAHNRLSGKIPASLAKLNLTVVGLSWNELEGDPSVFFGSAKRTEYMLLERNLFTFDIGIADLPKNLKLLRMNQ